MTLPHTIRIVRRPMLVLPVRVTNQCKRPILYMSSATCSLLLPMYASERERQRGREKETQINTFSLSSAHIYASLPYAYAVSLSLMHSGNGQTSNFLNCTIHFPPALCFFLSLPLFRINFRLYIPDVFYSSYIIDLIVSLYYQIFVSYQVK
jgi:hypothetical protein